MNRAVFCIVVLGFIAEGQDAQKLIQASDCSSCHAADRQIVGPAYSEVARRYAGQADATDKLAAKIRDGGGGMPSHPEMPNAQRTEIAKWILSQTASQTGQAVQTFTYTLNTGANVQLDFPLFIDAKGPKVTKDVFHGYQLYNSYCYRCHGTDATGGQLGPDLRRSVANMKEPAFLSTAMIGRKEQGMPAWAGFLSEKDVADVFKYVKGRSLDLVPSGRPASEQD
jgi:cytochrome c